MEIPIKIVLFVCLFGGVAGISLSDPVTAMRNVFHPPESLRWVTSGVRILFSNNTAPCSDDCTTNTTTCTTPTHRAVYTGSVAPVSCPTPAPSGSPSTRFLRVSASNVTTDVFDVGFTPTTLHINSVPMPLYAGRVPVAATVNGIESGDLPLVAVDGTLALALPAFSPGTTTVSFGNFSYIDEFSSLWPTTNYIFT